MRVGDIVQHADGRVGEIYHINSFEHRRQNSVRVEFTNAGFQEYKEKVNVNKLTVIKNSYLDFWHVIKKDGALTLLNTDNMYCIDVEGSIASFKKSIDASKHLNAKI